MVATALLLGLAAGCATGPTGSTASPAVTEEAGAASVATVPDTGLPEAAAVEEEVCVVPPRFLGVEVERLDVDARLVALTFDAGADATGVRSILDTLAARDVPATFFLTGRFVQTFPRRSQRMARLHLVGNHSMTHPDFTTLTDLQIRRQVRRAEAAILGITGEDPRRFFRFPLGARDQHTIEVVESLCYVPFRWTVDTLGWQGTSGGMTVRTVVLRVLGAAAPGAIVLMHVGANPDDGSTLDADALPRVIHRLRLAGYELVRLSRVLRAAP